VGVDALDAETGGLDGKEAGDDNGVGDVEYPGWQAVNRMSNSQEN
jgi:hypothetical protein